MCLVYTYIGCCGFLLLFLFRVLSTDFFALEQCSANVKESTVSQAIQCGLLFKQVGSMCVCVYLEIITNTQLKVCNKNTAYL